MPWFADVAIIAVVVWGVTEIVKMALEHRKLGKKAVQDAERGEMEAKIAALEERIKVLEAIVTDQSYDLKKKINAL
jgi:hypothetical protein